MSTPAILALFAMGAFHGLNPGMGWLLAVATGFQERSRAAVLRALAPIAAGHALSILATRTVAIGGGAVLVGFGLWRALSQRHFRWSGMRLTPLQLSGWSFLMSSIHGAGLMLVPVLVAGGAGTAGHAHHPATTPLWGGFLATAVHTAGMVTVAGCIALVVYQVVGLRILRSAWINLDRVWAFALVGAGIATVAVAV
jgi:hypothetical protein